MSVQAEIIKMPEPIQFRTDRPEMTRREAQDCRDDIKRHDKGYRSRLLDLHERKGWRILGYSTVEECAVTEFGISANYYGRLMRAAIVDRNIREAADREFQQAREQSSAMHRGTLGTITEKSVPIGTTQKEEYRPIPESHARELSKAPPEMQHEIHKEVTAKGPATAASYKEAIEAKGIIVTINKKERGEKRDDVAKRGKKRANKMKKAIRLLQKAQEALNSVLENGWAKRIADLAYEIQRAV